MRPLLFLFVMFFTGSVLMADSLRLTSGQVIDGTIIDESESTIVIRTHRGVVSVEKKDILDIEKTGAPKKIARVPRDVPDPLMATILSFVPFYSGLYAGADPGFGLPFAAANGIYAVRLLRLMFGSVNYTDWANKGTTNALFTVTILHTAAVRQTDPFYTPLSGTNGIFVTGVLFAPDVVRLVPTQAVKVGSKIYTKDEFRQYRRRTFLRYVGVSSISAGLTFAYFKWFRPPGTTAAVPETPGVRFASVLLEADPVVGTQVGVTFSF